MILLWRQRSLQTLRSFASNQIKSHCRHGLFTKPDGLKPETSEKARARLERLVSRLPKFLQAYTRPLLNAPVTHISAFLLLHELTAVIPLFVLAGTFHYTQWLPSSIGDGPLVGDGVEKFERYFRKRGWLGEEARGNFEWWGNGKGASRTVVEYVSTGLWRRIRS